MAIVAATAAEIDRGSVTSSGTRTLLRAVATTASPWSATARASASPRPELVPVMSHTFASMIIDLTLDINFVSMHGLRERKKAATRQAISDVATRLFEARGFEAVTVAEIAAAADVAVKTV